MRVIGTAGHVDHGKSALVKVLTGTHPDRLKEEIDREMTIELGFAWFTLPSGEEVGIVDVPGHRDFIGNMLAGVGGIDAVLLIIAVDEGVMPQTREHLAILDLLQIDAGIVVLTKIDMVSDPEWVALVEMDVHDTLKNTTLEQAPIVQVSSITGAGIDKLVEEISKLLEKKKKKIDLGRARLPVDRVFSIPGFGTVVTGTLLDGTFRIGDEVTISPKLIKSRIRGIQTHKKKVDFAEPGTRTAVNLTGVEVNEINRGDLIIQSGKYLPTRRFDAFVRVLADCSSSLKHNQEVKIFIGAAEILARARILGSDQIEPGSKGWVQFEVNTPIITSRTDRFIIRRSSPSETMGGGEVVNPFPESRHKRFSSQVIKQLESYHKGTPAEIFLQACIDLEVASLDEIVKKARIEFNLALELLPPLLADGVLLLVDPLSGSRGKETVYATKSWYDGMTSSAQKIIQKFHEQYPLRSGIPKEELKSKIKAPPKVISYLLKRWETEGSFSFSKTSAALHNHRVVFSKSEQQKVDVLISLFQKSPFSTPSVKECVQLTGEEVYNSLLDQNVLIQVSAEVVFSKSAHDEMLKRVIAFIESSGEISVIQFRDLFQTSRKYALGFLESLDLNGITFRDGDTRKLRQGR
jgi:selenocysteine-specific elongation factor